MRLFIAISLLLCLTVTAVADNPSIVKDGRRWDWNPTLSMYTPAGSGWHYDIDRGTFWRYTDCVCGPNCPKGGCPVCDCSTATARPPITYQGRRWTWDSSLKVYRPEGAGWTWDGTYWTRITAAPQSFAVPMQFMSGSCASGACFGGS